MNNILTSFKRLKANAAEGGKPYREETVEYKDVVDGLNIVVRVVDDEWMHMPGLASLLEWFRNVFGSRKIKQEACKSSGTQTKTWADRLTGT